MELAPTDEAAPPLSANRGKLVVLGIFAVALVLASFAWWWNLRQNRRASELWGRENIRLMRLAKHVELWELAPATGASEADTEKAEPLIINDVPYLIARRHEISQARGLVHARHALTEDASYDWTQTDRSSTPEKAGSWRLAVRFREGSQAATLLLDPTSRRVRLLETSREAIAIPRITAGWEKLAAREKTPNPSP